MIDLNFNEMIITIRTKKGAYERYYTESPGNKEIDQEFQYFGFGAVRQARTYRCWCSNFPPVRPRPMTDCENAERYASRIYTNTNSSKLSLFNSNNVTINLVVQ